jgi:hypothetical protein
LDQQPIVRGSWSSLLLEEGHKSLCLLYVSVFFLGWPGSTHLTRDPITWPGQVSKLWICPAVFEKNNSKVTFRLLLSRIQPPLWYLKNQEGELVLKFYFQPIFT